MINKFNAWLWSICLVVIISGIFCGFITWDILNRKGFVNGHLNLVYEDNSKFDKTQIIFNYIDFERNGDINEFNHSFEKKNYDGTKNEYLITINGIRLNDRVQTAGSYEGVLTLEFYDLNHETMYSGDLAIRLEFYANKSKLKISTGYDENSKTFWQDYFGVFGFNLEVKEI